MASVSGSSDFSQKSRASSFLKSDFPTWEARVELAKEGPVHNDGPVEEFVEVVFKGASSSQIFWRLTLLVHFVLRVSESSS